MNSADQIESIARATTDRLAAISRTFSAKQQQLIEEQTRERASRPDDDTKIREELRLAADLAEVSTPRIMLPADMAQASPHHRGSTE